MAMAVELARPEDASLLTTNFEMRWPESFINISYPQAVRWTRASERGIVGMVPDSEPPWIGASNGAYESVVLNSNGYSLVDPSDTSEQSYTIGQGVARGLNTGQVSRLIKIARDWSKQAEEASTYRAEHTVEDGVLILDPAPALSFDAAFASFVVDGNHRLVPRGRNGEHLWFMLWRLRAARAFLEGASAHAILAALRNQLARLRAGLASFVASAARTHASQLLRLLHYIVPNAPPTRLVAQVTC